jgi:hypothetical protein
VAAENNAVGILIPPAIEATLSGLGAAGRACMANAVCAAAVRNAASSLIPEIVAKFQSESGNAQTKPVQEANNQAPQAAPPPPEPENDNKDKNNKPPTVAQPGSTQNSLDPKWYDENGNVKWPDNRGFQGEPKIVELQPGKILERRGGPTGTFFTEPGTPVEKLSVPPEVEAMAPEKYRVLKPIPDTATGKAAPWFGKPGGGVQYKTKETVEKLIEQGFLGGMN